MGLDRIKQSVPVFGFNPVQLTQNAAPGGYQTFLEALTSQQVVNICIVDQVTFDFEVTTAIFGQPSSGAPGGTLARVTPATTSNNNIAVNFRGNNCDVFVVDTALPYTTSSSGNGSEPAATATPAQLAAYFAALPTAIPAGGGLWLDGGVLSYAPTTTPPDATTETLLAYFATLPTSPPAGGGVWNDSGAIVVAPL